MFLKRERYYEKSIISRIKKHRKSIWNIFDLRSRGFNGTAVNSESLRRVVESYPEEHHFFNFWDLEQHELKESILVIFVVDEDKSEELKDVIRWDTNNFTNPKGFMYSFELNDYEGNI